MSTDDRNLPLELRIPLGTVVDASTPPSLVSRNPGPSALTGASPGLATGAPTPLASPTLPDPSDPQAMALLFVKIANEMFGGSVVPAESPASIVGTPHGLHAPGSPGFAPTLVPGPAPAGSDLSNPRGSSSDSASYGSAPLLASVGRMPGMGAPGVSSFRGVPGGTDASRSPTSSSSHGGPPSSAPGSSSHGGSPFGSAPGSSSYGGAPSSAPGSSSYGGGSPFGSAPGSSSYGGSPFGSAPGSSSYGGSPFDGGPSSSSHGGPPSSAPGWSSHGGGSPFGSAPGSSSPGGSPSSAPGSSSYSGSPFDGAPGSSSYGGSPSSALGSSSYSGSPSSAPGASSYGGSPFGSAPGSSSHGGSPSSAPGSSSHGGSPFDGAPGSSYGGSPSSATGSSSYGGSPSSATGSSSHGGSPSSAPGSSSYGGSPSSAPGSSSHGGSPSSAPGSSSYGGSPFDGAPGSSSYGGSPTSGSPFDRAPSFANVGGMPAFDGHTGNGHDDSRHDDTRRSHRGSHGGDGGGNHGARSNPSQRTSSQDTTSRGSNPPAHGGSPHSGYGDAPSYSGAAPGYGARDDGRANQREGVPTSATQFAGGSAVGAREGGQSPTTVLPHGTPPPALTPAYSGGAPSAPPGVIHGAPKPSVPSTRHATEPVHDAPFGASVLDLSSLGLSPLGTSPQELTGLDPVEPVEAALDSSSLGAPFGSPLDLSSVGLSPYGRAPSEGMTLPVVDALPAGTAPYFLPPATALGIDMGEPRIAGHDIRPGGDDRLIRDLGGNAFDPYRVRKDFPILEERVHGGKRLVWLDNAATTQKPRAVIDRLSYFYAHENSNVHRAAHALAARATDAYESARESVRRFINAPSTKEIVWVRGATEGINLVAQSWGRRHVGKGDEIVITHLEHHANIVPWQMLCAEKGARLRVAPVDDRGDVILEEYQKLMGPRTRLVAIPQVSNALGTITPTREMVEIAHRYGAKVLVDGAQSVSHMRVDVQQLDCEWFVFSGHKVFAPTGIGAVFAKREILEASPPWQGGGNMIEDVTFEKTRYQPPPSRFEAGTGSIGDAVGLGAALDYVSKIGIETIDRYEHDLLVYGTRRLATVPGLTMIGTSKHKAGVMSFTLAGQRTEDISAELDKEGIAVRSGHHCAQPILRRFGVEATVRASLAFYNICEDIDALVEALHRLQAGRR